MSVPDSSEELLILEAQTYQERSREVFTKLRQQVTRLELPGASDASHRSFHVLPGVELERVGSFRGLSPAARRPGVFVRPRDCERRDDSP